MSPIISATGVGKTFRQLKRQSGFGGALKSLFSRDYTDIRAVDGISFAINAGEAVGYLGPNGAGKSTMIKMMTGILTPSAGTLSVLGREPHAHRMTNAAEIGVVFGQRSQLWWDLPVRDSFDLNRHIYDIPPARFADNLRYLTAMLDMASYLDRPVRQLSLGQRMRAEIAMALLHDPKILFLDEPTIGLDVVAKDAVRKFLAEINRERGTTIILTTHDLVDIEEICPRLIMVDDGKLLFDGELNRLRASLGSRRRLTLEFATDPGPIALTTATLTADEGAAKHFVLDDETVSLLDVLGELGRGHGLKDVKLEEPDIEEVIRTFYLNKPNLASAP
ncbi:ATP-binding cassette domain-containing protein [Devosia sp. XJ19-1]|uniref:ATP-binding cassette domain-containing protein n=1 Tax=Devosia ureilytica TaxID=2952754 RepID=A0A9Q4FT35_9HYPH|nr:ATP-binding cassette domain-containing protein [Devosia ureilytica]MCP8883892.1 ATP-binding cassette domain-containing protein [Devosia ureilytica]MCP8887500.1 ATP-binding cassette domain-containing protein [Devosia ureilytica]